MRLMDWFTETAFVGLEWWQSSKAKWTLCYHICTCLLLSWWLPVIFFNIFEKSCNISYAIVTSLTELTKFFLPFLNPYDKVMITKSTTICKSACRYSEKILSNNFFGIIQTWLHSFCNISQLVGVSGLGFVLVNTNCRCGIVVSGFNKSLRMCPLMRRLKPGHGGWL